MNTAAHLARGPTVVLIGGPMTVDDGTKLDSRQEVEGDSRSKTTGRALASSHLWWKTVESLVMPILESAGPDAFAAVIGKRSVTEVQAEGSTRRTLLRKLLPGGVTTDEGFQCGPGESLPDGFEEVERIPTWDNQGYYTVGFKRGDAAARWHFIDGVPAIEALGPTVVVETDGTWTILDEYYVVSQFELLEKARLYGPECVLVLPHTSASETFFRRYLEWNAGGRLPDPDDPRGPLDVDQDGAPDPLDYTAPVPIAADFAVTAYIKERAWLDPADLEAARSLLEARYDLKIGIWDLVGNPTLRRSLLDSIPVAPAPEKTAPVPSGASRRAQARVGERVHQREELAEAIAAVADVLQPLSELGWRIGIGRHGRTFRLPLAEAPRVFSDDPPEMDDFAQPEGIVSLLHIDLVVAKPLANVSAYSTLYGQVDIGSYAAAHRAVLEDIAAQADCTLGDGRPSLWRVTPGIGPDADWRDRAATLTAMTPRWIEVFSELAKECRRVRTAQGHPVR